jgi:hypothetical protein
MLRVYPRSNFVLPSTCAGHVRQTLSELVECGCEFVIVESLSTCYHSFTASEKLKIIEEDEAEIGLLEENSMSAKVTSVIDDEINNCFLKNGVRRLLE